MEKEDIKIEKPTFFQKLHLLQKKDIKIEKKGKLRGRWYATLDDINSAYKPALSDVGLVIYHRVDGNKLLTIVQDTDSDKNIETSFLIEDINNPVGMNKIQNFWSQITYAKRYNLGQLLNIVTDEDKDGSDEDKDITKAAESKELLEKTVFGEKELSMLEANLVSGDFDPSSVQGAMDKVKAKYEISKEMETKARASIKYHLDSKTS